MPRTDLSSAFLCIVAVVFVMSAYELVTRIL